MANENQAPQVKFRLAPELHTWLKHQALDNHRTLNQEVAYRLESSRRQQEASDAKTPA